MNSLSSGTPRILVIGRVVHRSRRLYVAESQLTDSDGREIARRSGTFVPSEIPAAAELPQRKQADGQPRYQLEEADRRQRQRSGPCIREADMVRHLLPKC